MKTIISLFSILILSIHLLFSQHTTPKNKTMTTLPQISFDKDSNTTSSYAEVVAFYTDIADMSPLIQVSDFGMTDSGNPLQEVIIASSSHFTPEDNNKAGKAILFINNGIHPGEPDGIDASMLFVRQMMSDQNLQKWLDHITIVIVPVYNIGGMLNRSSHSRANQLGPHAYGFRGNARNLDLNRDFIKNDSKNGISFTRLFHKWKPTFQVDTHTSNGADYSYTMTLIATQKDKLHPALSALMTTDLLPFLYKDMEKKDWKMIPYVNAEETPDGGIYGFLDLGRYSSGYAAIHHTISFMPETHMLKPYKDRVWSTLEFILSIADYLAQNAKICLAAKELATQESKAQSEFVLEYKLDKDKVEKLTFSGYTAKYKPSQISGIDRLYYDKSEPYTKDINFYNTYKPANSVIAPKAYIIPQAYDDIIQKMVNNGVITTRLEMDTTAEVEMYKIEKYKTSKSAYEGHYNHSEVEVQAFIKTQQFYKGDYIIHLDQISNRYIVEVMEPQAPDSWFAWGFFDGVLMQKEHYSAYVFEDTAAELIKNDKALAALFNDKKKNDEAFAKNGQAQLDFIYNNSPYYEATHNLYPVARLIK